MHRPVICLLAFALGCTSWRATTTPVPTLVALHQADPIRLTTDSGKAMVMYEPGVVGDTLAGRTETATGRLVPVQVPIDALRQVEWRRIDGKKTAALAVVTTLGLGAVIVGGLAIAFSGWHYW